MMQQSDEIKVQYNHLGRSGLLVSNICLGTLTFGKYVGDPFKFFDNQNQLEEEKAFEILNRFAEVGGNFIDTSNNYSYGKSEEIVGNWLSSQKRDRFVIATKCGVPSDMTNVNSGGLSRKNIVQTVEGSLKRLQTDYVDLLQTHIWDVATPIEETLRTLDDLVRSGKVRYIGCSNVCGWQLQKILCLSKSLGLTDFISLQQQYNLLTRLSELEEIQVCRNEGLGLIPFSALKNGLLTGKYKRDKTPEASQGRVGFMLGSGSFMLDSWSTYSNDEKFWNIQDKLTSIAGKHSKTVAQVSLRWLLQKEIVPSVIIGVTSLKQLEENVGAAKGWELTEGEMTDLDSATSLTKGYPYDAVDFINSQRRNPFLRM